MDPNDHNHVDADIREAVDGARHPAEAEPAHYPWYARQSLFFPYPAPVTRNPYVLLFWLMRCLWWGVTGSAGKIVRAVRCHPWVSVLGMGAAIGMCPVCKYATGTILAVLAVLAVCTGGSPDGKAQEKPVSGK